MVGHFALIISIFISKLLCALCEYKNYYVKLLLESGSGYVLRCDDELKTRQRSVCGMQIKRYYLACKVSKIFKGADRGSPRYEGRCEIDSHADTFVAGRNCTLMHYTERVCDVMPYSDEYEAKSNVPIAQVATGYTSSNGQRYILIFNEALWMPELENSLVNPNQLRHHGVVVQDNPYDDDPMTIRTDDESSEFVACLKSEGTIIFLDTWTPTDRDLANYPHVIMSSSSHWNPQEVRFPGITQTEVEEIESRGIAMVESNPSVEAITEFDDSYHKPLRVFDIRAFNARVMKSKVISTNISQGPLSEDEILPPRTFLSTKRHSNTTPEDLSEIWNISVEQAKLTLEATTQNHIRSAIMPLSRRYRVDRMFEPKRLRCQMASDTMDPRCEGMQGVRYCQVFGNRDMFCEAYPIAKKSDCDDALKQFIKDYGAPDVMITDGSREQTSKGSKFQATLRKNNVTSVVTQPHRPNQNPSETVIRELRKKWYRAMFRTNCPKALWNFGLPHFSKLMQLTATYAANLNGKTPLEIITGETPDISQYLDFAWYDWVWYKENAGLAIPKLGRFLGVANSASNIMSFYLLPESGIVVTAGTVQRVTELEKQTEAVKDRMQQHSKKIAEKFKEGRLSSDGDMPKLEEWADLLEDDEDFAAEFNRLFDNTDVKEADDTFDPDSFDHYLNMEVNIDRGGEFPD